MALNLERKKAIVDKLSKVAENSISALAADYRGLNVSEMTELRKKARETGVKLGVYRNTLARRAFQKTSFACLQEALVGPIVLLFSEEELGAAARLAQDFMKTHEKFTVKALVLDGRLLDATNLKSVASLPSRNEAIAQLLSVMQAPVAKFVRTLNEPVAQFVRVMGQVQEKKQQA